MTPLKHAKISEHKFGGHFSDYLPIHEFIDSSKAAHADIRHRAILHSSFGCYIVEQVLGEIVFVDGTPKRMPYITNSAKRHVSVREIAEQHIIDDLGFIPSVDKWLNNMTIQAWMGGNVPKMKYKLIKGMRIYENSSA